MQVTITGPRAGGATTIAALIMRTIEQRGMVVRVRCDSTTEEQAIRDLAREGGELDTSRRAVVTIVCGFESEDEATVKFGIGRSR